VWPNEWQLLQQWYTSEDKQICLLKMVVQDGIQYTSSPGEYNEITIIIIIRSCVTDRMLSAVC